MTQISITRALAQVKSLNERIQRSTNGGAFIALSIGGKHNSGKSIQEVEALLKSNLQSVEDLIKVRKELKSAIVKSNAVTIVKIGGDDMTVAEAIERKSSIALEQQLLNTIATQQAQAIAQAERNNVQVDKEAEALLNTAVGRDRTQTSAELEAITGPFKKQREAALIDPNGVSVVIERMSKDLDAFLLEVDYALSEVNAKTLITV